jgi:CDP-diacylglycerol--glycerol-3-phosphate 3-phosphatidyltransferase
MVSYTRARAEALGLDCSAGLMQRAERVLLLGGGSLFFGLMWDGLVLRVVLILLAAASVLTAIQRIVWVYHEAAGVPLDEAGPRTSPRHGPSNRNT